nr:methylamine utilization protein MauJ [Ectothiorhodospira shaposhnikovii]
MSINSIPFAFLSYFKILNVLSGSGSAQKNWINNNLSLLWYQPAVDRLNEVRASNRDVGAYLYHQGRCAVAHAFDRDVVNPDKYEDKKRLELDLPLMKEVAALCIEQGFGVLSDCSFWGHLKKTQVCPPELLQKHSDGYGRIIYRQYTDA